MTDIVKRLRGSVSQENDIFWGQRPGEEVKSYDVVRFDASYEIERLRAENEHLRAALENVQQARVLQGKAITDASNEIERLRAALVDCRVELDDYYMREYRSDDPIIQQRLEEKMALNPARVALEKKHD